MYVEVVVVLRMIVVFNVLRCVNNVPIKCDAPLFLKPCLPRVCRACDKTSCAPLLLQNLLYLNVIKMSSIYFDVVVEISIFYLLRASSFCTVGKLILLKSHYGSWQRPAGQFMVHQRIGIFQI